MTDVGNDPVVEFIRARLDEDEAAATALQRAMFDKGPAPAFHDRVVAEQRAQWPPFWRAFERYPNPARVLAHCAALREIVALHEKWPILVEHPASYDVEMVETSDPSTFAMRASQQIAWLTEQEYRTRFGSAPPTAPMVAAIAKIWADHPDYPGYLFDQAERAD